MKSNLRHGMCMVFPACAVLLFCSCGAITKDKVIAEQATVQFHSQLNAGQYNSVYDAADPKLHEATTEANLAKLLDAVHRKLGTVRQSNLLGWSTNWHTGQGTTVTLSYNTTFSAGSGTEQFVWHIDQNRALLYGYDINSADLIEK